MKRSAFVSAGERLPAYRDRMRGGKRQVMSE